MALLPVDKISFEVENKQGQLVPVQAVDWNLDELALFHWREDQSYVAPDVAIQPPANSFTLKSQFLNAPPWNNNAVFWCGHCRIWRPASVLMDVEGLPLDLTDGRKWACDGCRTRWFRLGKLANGEPISKRIWGGLLVDAHGAPREFMDRIDALPDADQTYLSI